jgi:hypothetical protein
MQSELRSRSGAGYGTEKRISEFSRRSKSKSGTSRSQTPSKSPEQNYGMKKKKAKKFKPIKTDRRQALITEQDRDNLQHYI